jgi:signal transduction histidine kinase
VKRPGLLAQVFLSILAVALAAILATGIIARRALETAFETYLTALGMHSGPGGGVMRRSIIGTTEQAFLQGVDRGIIISAVVAVALAAVAAFLLARYLADPLRRLTEAARTLAAGDLTHRVEAGGPEEVGELASAFNDMAASLSEAESLKGRLIADVAHELRNPIAALRAQIEGMAEGVLPADGPHLASLVEDVGTLSRLVDGLQELSVAEAGRLDYERTAFDVRGVVVAEVERAQVMAGEGVVVSADLPTDAVTVTGDEFRIAQVIRNLLSNAVRHTAAGAITARVMRGAGGEVTVEVTDTGEGIAADDLPHIWERFYRADTARAPKTGGTGIGLAISRRIVEDHGGTVFARSESGRGSTIGFTLPGYRAGQPV